MNCGRFKDLESAKWYLWHGNVFQAFNELQGLEMDVEGATFETKDETARKLLKGLEELHTYVERRCGSDLSRSGSITRSLRHKKFRSAPSNGVFSIRRKSLHRSGDDDKLPFAWRRKDEFAFAGREEGCRGA